MACGLLLGHDTRLLTITGSPGIGKTRLALRVAYLLSGRFRDGVFYVPLATVADPALVMPCIARTLGIDDVDEHTGFGRLRDYLRAAHLLLVLDNFEQVHEAAPLVADLMEGAPGVRVLATSRTLLNIYGEHALPVPPLSVPPANAERDAQSIGEYESVALFVARAAAARPDFALTDANASTVAEICRLLDGVPLAIELAAARTRAATSQAVLERLKSEPLHYLKGGAQNSPLRQQTFREAIGWSYRLLTPAEQSALRRLSVFVGGFTHESASAILDFGLRSGETDDKNGSTKSKAQNPRSVELIESLLAKSLLSIVEVAGETRFYMLNTIREYAMEMLEEEQPGEADQARLAHALYFLELAETAKRGMYSSEQARWLNRLETEHDNLRVSLRWIADSGFQISDLETYVISKNPQSAVRNVKSRIEMALRMSQALWLFWEIRGYLSEGFRMIISVLEDKASLEYPGLRAKALVVGGRLSLVMGDLELAQRLYAESLVLSKQGGDPVSASFALTAMGHLAVCAGDVERAEPLYIEGLEIRRGLDQMRWVVHSLVSLGDLYNYTGRYEEAASSFAESLALAEELGDKNAIGRLCVARGHLWSRQHDYTRAEAFYFEGLGRFAELKSRHGRAECVAGLAELAYEAGRLREAAILFGWVYSVFYSMGLRWDLVFHNESERIVAELKSRLGDEYAALEARGAALADDEVESVYTSAASEGEQEEYRSSGDTLPNKRPILITSAHQRTNSASLTGRELEVLRLIASGLTNAEAAERLIVSPYTVNMHLRSIYHKLGVSNRSAATKYAVERHIV